MDSVFTKATPTPTKAQACHLPPPHPPSRRTRRSKPTHSVPSLRSVAHRSHPTHSRSEERSCAKHGGLHPSLLPSFISGTHKQADGNKGAPGSKASRACPSDKQGTGVCSWREAVLTGNGNKGAREGSNTASFREQIAQEKRQRQAPPLPTAVRAQPSRAVPTRRLP